MKRIARLFHSTRRPLPAALLCALLAGTLQPTGVAHAGPGVWTGNGPHGGTIQRLAVSDSNPNRVYAATQSGLFRSDNEGLIWQDQSTGLPYRYVTDLAVDPDDADIVYVSIGAGQLFRSIDGGTTWLQLQPTGGTSVGALHSVQIDPSNPQQITLGAWLGGIYRSTDQGLNWTRIDGGFFEAVASATVLPDNADTLLVNGLESGQTTYALYRSTDGGLTWSVPTTPPAMEPWYSHAALRLTSAGASKVLAHVPFALFHSNDGGDNWNTVSGCDPLHALAIQTASIDPADHQIWYLGGGNGLVRATGDGANCTGISAGLAPQDGIDAAVATVVTKPGSPNTYFAGTAYAGFFRSTDAGATWARRNQGLRATHIRAVAIHPADSAVVYAGHGDSTQSSSDRLWTSLDTGASWNITSDGLFSGDVRMITVDPNTAANPATTHLYSVGWGMPIQGLSGSGQGYTSPVFKSVNGASDWAESGTGIPIPNPEGVLWANLMRAVVLDPQSGSGMAGDGPLQTVYIAGNGHIVYDPVTGDPEVIAHRIYKSTDAGASWTPSDNGLPVVPWDFVHSGAARVAVVPLVIDPVNPQNLYAGTFISSPTQDASDLANVDNGIFKSTDGGATWALSSNGLPRYDDDDPTSVHWDVLSLAISASNPNVLYASAHQPLELRPSRLFRTTDGGANWLEANTGIPTDADIRWLLVDPNDPDIAYAANSGTVDNPAAVYRTHNGGNEWVSYSIGLPSDSSTALAIDVSGPNPVLYAGTRGGVYRIEQVPDDDIDGVPDSVENGAPNGGDGNGDGIPDALQTTVGSLPAPEGLERNITGYVTVELIETGSDTCTRLSNVHVLPPSSFPIDPHHIYPHGMIRFEIGSCAATRVRLHYHGMQETTFDSDWLFRVYAPDVPGDTSTIRWQSFPAQIDSANNAWIIDLADGQFGDLRPANGTILFQGGPALIPDNGLFSDRFEQP